MIDISSGVETIIGLCLGIIIIISLYWFSNDLLPLFREEQTEEYNYNEIIDKYGLEKGLEIIEILESDK